MWGRIHSYDLFHQARFSSWFVSDQVVWVLIGSSAIFLLNDNIFSQEIKSISKSILNGSNEVSYPGMQLEETLLNMKILDCWKNEK